MSRKQTIRVLVGVMLVGSVIGICIALRSWPPGDSGQVAAWVQAVGSIAAIAAAILVASDQHRQALERDKREGARRMAQLLGVPLAVAERAMDHLGRCIDYAKAPAGNIDWGPSADLLEPAAAEIERFAALPMQELPYRLFKSAYELLDLLYEAVDRGFIFFGLVRI